MRDKIENPSGVSKTLRSGKLGVADIVFFVVAAAAPLVGMTGALPPSIALGSGATVPGVYLLVGLILLFFSAGFAAMSHRVTNAGAFFAYVARGLGYRTGIGAAFMSLVAYVAMLLSIYGFLGAMVVEQFGGTWWVWALAAWVLVTALSVLQVDVGAKILGIFMLLELACLLLLSVAILSHGGPEGINFMASFSPSAVISGGAVGSAGIGFAFAFASFIGFEATAIYGEESKNPKKVVPQATYAAIITITCIFALTSFSVVTGLGSQKVVDEVMRLSTVDNAPLTAPAAVLFHLATQYVGSWLSTLMGLLVMSSLFAGLLAFQNSTSRYIFSLARAGSFPKTFQHVNKFGAPAYASLLVALVAGLVIGFFALAHLDPVLNMFFWFSGMAVVAIVLIEVLVCVSIIVFFSKDSYGEGIYVTKVAPAIAALGLSVGAYLLMSRFGLLTGAVPEGIDPTAATWVLTPVGWVFMVFPALAFLLGVIITRSNAVVSLGAKLEAS